MPIIVWIIAVILLLPVAWFVLKTVLAFAISEQITGVALLKQELRKHGVPYQHLPPEFFKECVEWVTMPSVFTEHNSKIKQKAEFVRSIESLANMIVLWRAEPNNSMFVSHSGKPSSYRKLFEKYQL
jgi:hypothetical protein